MSIIAGPGCAPGGRDRSRILELAGRAILVSNRAPRSSRARGDVICIGTADSNRALAALSVRPAWRLPPAAWRAGLCDPVRRCEGRQVCLAAGGGAMAATSRPCRRCSFSRSRMAQHAASQVDAAPLELRGTCCFGPQPGWHAASLDHGHNHARTGATAGDPTPWASPPAGGSTPAPAIYAW